MGEPPRKTIGFVTTSFPRTQHDHAGRFVFELARAFSRWGFGVEVVVPEPSDDVDWQRTSEWLEGIRMHAAPYARPRGGQRLFFGAGVPDNIGRNPLLTALIPSAFFSLSMTVKARRNRWDAVMSHWLLPSALAVGLSRGRGLRHLAVAHSGDVHLLSKPVVRRFSHLLYPAADRFGFISEELKSRFLSELPTELADRFGARSLVTPMGIDTSAFAPPSTRETARHALGLSRFTLLYLGRLVPIKGVELLLRSLFGIGDVDLVVAGDGPCRGELEEMARAHRLPARFIGAVSPAFRAELMGACDALVIPSVPLPGGREEGLPLVVSEAFASGLPVIAADTGGIGELVIHGENGWLFRAGDVAGVRKGVTALRSDSKMRASFISSGRAAASARDWQRLLPIFERALFE